MNPSRIVMAIAMAFPITLPGLAHAQSSAPPDTSAPVKSLGVVTVTGGAPTSLPTQIPTTIEGITGAQIEQSVNATDSEDALKYFPSLLVRKRYIGDYNHAILSSRASGTGNSARSAVYADGILLSNYLGNGVGGISFPPRWGLVTPEEIDRVDVMYGPFSAAYPGNSVGAVVDYVTRMPTQFEAHAKTGYVNQPFDLYNTHASFDAWQHSVALGSRSGDWSWYMDANHTDSHGQPLTFATRTVSSGTNGAAGTPVTGAVLDRNNTNTPIYILGSGTEFHTLQDHFKLKLAYDVTPVLRASYTLGLWQNNSQGRPASYLRNAAGQPVTSGTVNINGKSFALAGSDFTLTQENLSHTMQGLSVKSHTQGIWDWELAASRYDYGRDEKRSSGASNVLPGSASGGAGTLADGSGTGWNTLALKGIWRPQGISGAHLMDFGVQQDHYTLQYRTTNTTGNWLSDPPGTLANEVGGQTRLQSVYAQDVWAFDPKWKAVLGARLEHWTAVNGFTTFGTGNPAGAPNASYATRNEDYLSPKAALSYQWRSDTVLKGSLGRAVRMPTVSELYGAVSTVSSVYVNDPTLSPEKSWTTELSAEKDLGPALLRVTVFTEDTQDGLFSQTTTDPLGNSVSRVQNVGRIKTQGLEVAYTGFDVLRPGLDLSGSVTYADSTIKDNSGYVSAPGDTLGKQQPNIPQWRASALASYRLDAHWSGAFGARYSGPQFRTLNNADVYGYTYQGVSEYFTADVRVRYQADTHWSASFGVDNLNNYTYWNFHPYPNRSYVFELKCDI